MSPTQLVLKLCGPVLRFVIRDDDDSNERLRKSLLVPTSFIILAVLVYLVAFTLIKQKGSWLGVLHPFCMLVYTLGFQTHVFWTRSLSATSAGFFAVSLGILALLGDLRTYGLLEYYTTAVIVMDVLLLCGSSHWFCDTMFVVTTLTILVQTTEQTVGLGLYEQVSEDTAGYTRPEAKGSSLFISLLLIRLFVFCCDFMMTRYFARSVRRERERMQSSIALSQKIAIALGRFDLDAASEMVQNADDLPPELTDAFQVLLQNLCTYRPFLPQSCLPDVVLEEVEDVRLSLVGNELMDASILSSTMSSTPPSSPTTLRQARSMYSSSLRSPVSEKAVQCNLVRKSVTIIMVNICRFLDLAKSGVDDDLAQVHDKYLSTVLFKVKENKGLVDFFLCDRVSISFNATKPCASHHLRALHALKGIEGIRLSTATKSLTLSIGAASGDVLTGVLGTEHLRNCSNIGSIPSTVYMLERLSSEIGEPALVDTTLFDLGKGLFHFRLVDLVRYVKRGKKARIYYPDEAKKEDEEWMYLIESTEKWGKYNEVLNWYLRGEVEHAKKMLREVDPKQLQSAEWERQVRLVASEDQGGENLLELTELGSRRIRHTRRRSSTQLTSPL